MHVEKRQIGNKVKLYLAHSYREGNKVHKIRKYLGLNLKPELFEERKKIAEKLILDEIKRYKIIHDPLTHTLSKREINWVKKLEREIPIKVSHLSMRQWSIFTELFTYNTNAIEGSKLNSKEVTELLEKDKWPDKSKEDIAEAYGVRDAIRLIRKTKNHLSITLIKKIHRIVFKNSKSFAGQLRKHGEEVVVMDNAGRVVHEGAPQPRVTFLLKELCEWHTKNKERYPALILAAVIHNQFENIHPFRDGNGRVGRILLNNILIKHKLPPINIDLKNRMEYYASLQSYEKNHDLKPTINLFMKEYKTLKRVLGDYKKRRV
ncbi:MAG TPA: Fic family protein [Candidatus Nanoarchaeia archaeon]|nr:Fic family protein [Candidatus Nanoarchaeia archaeon]